MPAYMISTMVRTMVYLDEETKALLKARAQRQGVSEAKIIREALRKHLASTEFVMPRVVGRSTDGGVARNLDEALDVEGFGRDHAR